MSPRQKMINLMYLVLMAMLALNVSTDVLDGFELVREGVDRSAEVAEEGNRRRYRQIEAAHSVNPVKTEPNYRVAQDLRKRADKLSQTIDSLKQLIAEGADGEGADFRHLEKREDLDAAAVVMLSPVSGHGERLRKDINDFASFISPLISDSVRRESAVSALDLEASTSRLRENPGVSWEEASFSKMPATAALTLLSNLQGDIRYAESEALESLMTGSDAKDVRVNELEAFVVPTSRIVMSGSRFTADVVMAAVDTTSRPVVWLGKSRQPEGMRTISLPAGGTGTHTVEGHIEVTRHDGGVEKRPFSTTYSVIPPTATVAPLLMNVFYSGIDNPVSVSVPGLDPSTVSVTMTNGTIRRDGSDWVARPSVARGECSVTVSAEVGGKSQTVSSVKFRVRPLPDPVAYLSLGGENRYKGSPRRISRSAFDSGATVMAELDGDLPDVRFTVISFSTVFLDAMGNVVPETGDGDKFSNRQRQQIRRLRSGGSFFINNIRAKGPDGTVRDLTPMQVTVN